MAANFNTTLGSAKLSNIGTTLANAKVGKTAIQYRCTKLSVALALAKIKFNNKFRRTFILFKAISQILY